MRVGNRTTQGSFEDFARDRFIIGGKASVKEEITRYRELLGVDHFIMCAVAGPAAGTGTRLDPATWRDFRVVGFRLQRLVTERGFQVSAARPR